MGARKNWSEEQIIGILKTVWLVATAGVFDDWLATMQFSLLVAFRYRSRRKDDALVRERLKQLERLSEGWQ